jgi:hypothetical protein
MSRALRLGIGLVGLIPVIGITGGALVAAGVEGLAVAWIALAVGVVWIALVVWWVRQAPEGKKPSSVWRPPSS